MTVALQRGQRASESCRNGSWHRAQIYFDYAPLANYHPDRAMRVRLSSSRSGVLPNSVCPAGLWILLVAFCLPAIHATTIPRPHPHQSKQVVHIIETLEQRWQQAELDANTAVMASMLSDDYLGIYADGMLATKAETLASFKDGTTHFTAIHASDRKIRVFGSTAVVVSKAEVTGTNDGEQLNGHYRYTRVYHRSNGVWKIVNFEVSSIHKRKSVH